MEHFRRFRTAIIIGAATLVAAIVVFSAVISPEGSKLTSLQAQQTQLQAQQTRLTAEITTLRHERAQLAGNCQKLTSDIGAIPGTPDVDSFLNQITALAVSSGDPNTPNISVTQATSGGSAASAASGGSAGVTAVAVSFTLLGNYGQMSAFVSGLDTFPRLFTVSSITIAGGPAAQGGGPVNPATGGYTLTLQGDIYYSVGRQNVCADGAPSGSAAKTAAVTKS